MSSQKKGRRKGTDSTRKKPASKSHAGEGWIAIPASPSWMVPRWKSDKYPAELNVLLADENPVGGVIHKSTLYATITSLDTTELSSHLPRRADSLFLHPDTMRCCSLSIAQPVALRSTACEAVVVCKSWPVAALELDAAAMGPTAQLSFHGSSSGLVEIWGLTDLSSLPTAHELHVQPCFKPSFPLTDSFKNYFVQMHEGQYVCCGNYLAVQFYGEKRVFRVTAVKLADLAVASSDSTVDVSLLRDLSALSLQAIQAPSRTSQPPVTSSTPKGKEASFESIPNTSLQVEPESTLSDESGMEDSSLVAAPTGELGDTLLRAVQAYKITARTRIVIDKQQAAPRVLQPSLTAIGGLKQQTRLLRELLLFPMENSEAAEARGLWFPHGVLLHGAPGVGKSLLAQALATEAPHSIIVSATDLLASIKEPDHRLQEVFREALEKCPCLVVLEDLHVLCPHRDSAPSETERKTSATLASLLDQLHREPPSGHVVVIATTNQLEGVEPSLRRPGRFDREIEIPVPNAQERKEILDVLLRVTNHTLSEEAVLSLAGAAHGHVGADLFAVCQEAHYKALRRVLEGGGGWEGVKLCHADMKAALCEVRPSAMREVTLEVPKVLWSDVGGEDDIKQRLRESVEWPLRHPEAFSRLGIHPPKGVLLYGPPGCSKTMIAKALATESGLNFIAVKGPELFSKWVGDSEKAVRQVFSRARAAAPAIVFFDEIDALAVHRKSEGSTVGDRVLAQLLTEMDGVEFLREVLVVAATNRPDLIDKALLRPGRIDRLIYVPLPSVDTRREILKLQFQRTPVGEDVELEALVTKTEGFSGAEVVSLCQEAALSAMHEDIASPCVCQRHFHCALGSVRPQTDPAMLNFYENYCKSGHYRGAPAFPS